jgi:CRP-like cAMP-binding protein
VDALGILRDVALLAAAPEAELRALADASSPRRLGRGQILFVEGEPSSHLYVVIEGRLKVLVSSPRGEDLVLAVLTAGDSLGDVSVLDEQPRSAAAEALEPTVLLAVPADAIRAVLHRCPELLLDWAQDLAATVRRLTGSAADLVFLDLPRRLAKLLVESADTANEVHLGLSQGDVAARLGVTRQSLNRALGGLTRRGWITTSPTVILLTDPDALSRFAES